MKPLLLFSAACLLTLSMMTGCASSNAKIIPVEQVGKLVEAKMPNVAILDVNPDDVRKDKGVVPGAIKLTSYDKYALTELPQDKNTQLIFYCYNSFCLASDEAADRAIKAGYTNVGRMRAGITGWQDHVAALKK
jgi:rhodanese-related sulfurtransferase